MAGPVVAQNIESLARSEQELVKLVEKLSPQVAAITAWREVAVPEDPPAKKTDKGRTILLPVRGSGCVVSRDGWILTNEHVIRQTKGVQVMLWDGREFEAKVLGADGRSDLAVLKIPARDLVPVQFGDLSTVRRGQWALAMGNPLGMAFDGQSAVSLGIVSGIGRHVPKIDLKEDRYYGNLILTSAPINIGNSGGPLFDLSGRVIGITTIISTTEAGGSQMGFAVPVDAWTRQMVDRLGRGEMIEYGYIGVSLAARPGRTGAFVEDVLAGTPADKGQLRVNDLIVAFNGQKITGADHLILLIGRTIPGKLMVLHVVRDGKAVDVTLTSARRKDFVHVPAAPAEWPELKSHEKTR